ncbi:MAG: hypothetical protein ABSF71_14795, partial [Terriglobia bacterium]
PALLASNRRNAKKSTGPRTARGKAWSSKLAVHPLFTELAEICARAEIDIGNESRWRRAEGMK